MSQPPLPGARERWALFLDIDGTLLPIAATPWAVQVEPGLLVLLARLQDACGGALALVSGRRLQDIDRLFQPLHWPAAGLHGWERRRADGRLAEAGAPAAALDALRPNLAQYVAARPGLLLEDKGMSIAIHYRQAPRVGPELGRFVHGLAAAAPQLRVMQGKMLFEVMPCGTDKGSAVAQFLAEPPFAGRRPVYAGDDTTDEDGFAVVNRLDGLSIRVASQGRQASTARFRLASPSALRRWLAAVAAQLGGEYAPGQGTAGAQRAFSR